MNFFEDVQPLVHQVIRAPEPLKFFHSTTPLLFLAGSIEQGTAQKWQQATIDFLKDTNVIILDPRRDDWDASVEDDTEAMQEQVTWELQGLEEADIVLIHFDPQTKSPISLLELGLLLAGDSHTELIVSCAPDFYRYKNVRITCERYEVTVYNTIEEAYVKLTDSLNSVRKTLENYKKFGIL